MSKKLNFGEVLCYAQDNDINAQSTSLVNGVHFPYHRNYVFHKPFVFQASSHDTGIDVRGYILGMGDPYEIINKTYWKTGGYDHNESKWERGLWDDKLNEAISDLSEMVQAHKDAVRKKAEDEKLKEEKSAQSRKEEVEKLFAEGGKYGKENA
jgi:hypothetical protein